jgi:transposase InsO family protein
VSESAVRRLYQASGLDRVPLWDGSGERTRLRWQAAEPGALWHGDVCHGPALTIRGQSRPLRIHALLDDASRHVVALEARHTEREVDMPALFVRALRKHGAPDVLYLDNGSTYSGEVLRTACARLGISLVQARPYDPEARGKMERFWRTLREGCLDHFPPLASLHHVEVRLLAFLDRHYHVAPHASLMGRAPGAVFAATKRPPDSLDQGFLAGRVVTLAYSLLDGVPWLEHEGRRLDLHEVDPVANARRKRLPRRPGAGRRRKEDEP